MQFHLNGFRPGDPHRSPERVEHERADDECDVVIVGSGPAGLTLAAQLSCFPEMRVRLFERDVGPLVVGRADGIACRSMEMFEAFGFADQVFKEAYQVNETCFWRPGPDGRDLSRADRIQDVETDLSHQPHVILNQSRVHDFYLKLMQESPSRLLPDYDHRLVELDVTNDDAFPVSARFERSDGSHNAIRSRYLVGCDGARSAVRQNMGHQLRGESARQLWGVMDVLAVTDFPDIRFKCAIQSAHAGSMLIIPREGGYLVRLYIELDQLRDGERAADRHVTPDILAAKARDILKPYAFTVKEVAWCSAYEIGQRVCDAFDDVPSSERSTRAPRLFIAGDACHTHSPKAGQGMNVSMADAFNLGWKLAAVVTGRSRPALLSTYSEERRAKALELIEFDRDMARLFSATPRNAEEKERFQRYFQKHGRYTAGVETTYEASTIVGDAAHQELATGFVVGSRFHSAPVVRLADAKHMQLGEVLKADGRWRILVFADSIDTGAPGGRLVDLCDFLGNDDTSPLKRYTPDGSDPDSVIDLRVILQMPHRTVNLGDLPSLLLPAKGRYKLIDYEKIFCASTLYGEDIFDRRGIDRIHGVMVVVRPDQFVSLVLPLGAHDTLTDFFSGILIEVD
ncbi:MAG: FAD-dependent monooxygenase [Granulosicoccus sp.]